MGTHERLRNLVNEIDVQTASFAMLAQWTYKVKKVTETMEQCGICRQEFEDGGSLLEHTRKEHDPALIREKEKNETAPNDIFGMFTTNAANKPPVKDNLIINGVSTTEMPPYCYIYKSGLDALAFRLKLGEIRKQKHAINATRHENTRKAFADNKFALARMNNCINHVLNAINKLTGGGGFRDEDHDPLADAGAIMFAGMVLAEYYHQQQLIRQEAECQQQKSSA